MINNNTLAHKYIMTRILLIDNLKTVNIQVATNKNNHKEMHYFKNYQQWHKNNNNKSL